MQAPKSISPEYAEKLRPLFSASKRKKIRILSIDGGGLKGIIPGTILTYIEEQLQLRMGNPSVRLADFFDFMAGTSTGGILVCTYLTPDPNNLSRPRLTAKEALNLYRVRGKKIFGRTIWQKIKSLCGITSNKFNEKELESALKDTFGINTWLRDFVKPCLITSVDLFKQIPILFTSETAGKKRSRNFRIWEVARATSAAPSYFKPTEIQAEDGTTLPVLDGGVVANNPGLCAFTEVRKMNFADKKGWEFSKPVETEDMIIVSLGTGTQRVESNYNRLKKKGLLSWFLPVIKMRMMGTSDTVDHHLSHMFGSSGDYYRIDPKLYDADTGMDNGSEKNLHLLHEAGLKNIEAHKSMLDEIIDKLIAHHHAPVTIPASQTEVRMAG